ncbi:MAG: hypothetical protein ACOYMM_14295 [Phycisphaerales bacterium]|jgi:hypothetical protein
MSASHTTTEQLDDPEMGATWFYSFVGIIFFVAFCLAVSVMYFGVQRNFEEERVIDERPVLSTGLRSQQKELLAQYGTYAEEVDDKKVDRVRIPIERAMELRTAQGK